jgi:hypothetical protein
MDAGKGTVILLPRTIDYYQRELTRLLETERYAEAIELLRFLLQCRPGDPRTLEEWQMLHAWLESQFGRAQGTPPQEEDELEEEAAMLKAHVTERAMQDGGYGGKLLEMLMHSDSIEKQLLSLEQLAFLPDPSLNEPISRWLGSASIHPLVQFKGLQILKARGARSPIQVMKEGKRVRIDLDDVPSGFDDFPRLIQSVMFRVRDVCEVHSPGLVFIAEQIWKQFLAYAFGTELYAELVRLEEEEAEMWAAGLHAIANEWMGGETDDEDVMSSYGLTERDRREWQRVCRRIRSVFQA